MNIPLLRRIQRQIDKAPERFQMASPRRYTSCGTAFCIGGWACELTKTSLDNFKFDGTALGARALGLSWDESMRLIWMSNWPTQFQGRDDFSEEAAGRAIARIDHFIATEGRE